MRPLTKKDRDRGRKMHEFGCVVCLMQRGIFTPSGIHHIDGQTKPGCHQKTIPLCGPHHLVPSNSGEWFTLHHNKKQFEDAYGTQQELLTYFNKMIGEHNT